MYKKKGSIIGSSVQNKCFQNTKSYLANILVVVVSHDLVAFLNPMWTVPTLVTPSFEYYVIFPHWVRCTSFRHTWILALLGLVGVYLDGWFFPRYVDIRLSSVDITISFFLH